MSTPLRFQTMITYQTFDCIIKVQTEFSNKSKEFYNDNEDIALMMFDIKYGHLRWVYVQRYCNYLLFGSIPIIICRGA